VPPSPTPISILLITLDTVRADRLGRGFTPTLDRLASQSLRFTHARTVAPLTLPAHVSMMTGLLPSAHGVRLNGSPRAATGGTMAAELRDAGYATRAVVGAFVLDRRFGLDEGFEQYDDWIARRPHATDVLEAERPANEVIDRAIAALDALASEPPWFLWVHLYDAHAPYRPPADALARARGVPYDGEIAFVDAELARLLARLDRRSDASRTATIVVGDHGESLGEHGEPTHGMLLFEPALRVPLIIRWPGVAPGERRDAASITDIARTVSHAISGASAADTSAAESAGRGRPGRNLLRRAPEAPEAYSETDYPSVAGWSPVQALVNERWKLVRADRPALYDLEADPHEQTDLASRQSALAGAMSGRIDEIRRASQDIARAHGAAAPTVVLPAETAARLRSLGYVAPIQPAAAPSSGATDPAAVMSDWADFETALAEANDGQSAQALPKLRRLVIAHPASVLFTSTYARTLADAGRHRDALDQLRRAVARWPAEGSLYHELAVVARDLGHADEALRGEEAALAITPANPQALNGKGLLLIDAGRVEDAARAFKGATAADPTNAVYHANLGNARRALGDLDGAEAAYRRALERSATLGDALNGLGAVLVQRNRPAEAVTFLEQAARDEAFVEAQLNLGIALQQSGNRWRAAEQYRRVLAAPGRYARERAAAEALLGQVQP
jgi:arylsulfatase A-like enzyme/Tfp pilus assembly protein PilF